MYGNTTDAALRVITCCGTFDDAAGSYENNTVVYAHLTNPPPPATTEPSLSARLRRLQTGWPGRRPSNAASSLTRPPSRSGAGGPRVSVRGIGPAIPACASSDAAAFARRTLANQQVTLVPHSTLPPPPSLSPGPNWRAYVVLASQLVLR